MSDIIKHIPDLKRYVHSKIQSNFWADDIIQETLLYLLLKIDNIKVTNLKGLVLNTANFFISKYRNKRHYNNEIPDKIIEFKGEINLNDFNTYILDDTIYNKLLTVNKEYFNKFILQIHGYSIKEIAIMNNMNENTVKTQIKRCKDYLKH